MLASLQALKKKTLKDEIYKKGRCRLKELLEWWRGKFPNFPVYLRTASLMQAPAETVQPWVGLLVRDEHQLVVELLVLVLGTANNATNDTLGWFEKCKFAANIILIIIIILIASLYKYGCSHLHLPHERHRSSLIQSLLLLLLFFYHYFFLETLLLIQALCPE